MNEGWAYAWQQQAFQAQKQHTAGQKDMHTRYPIEQFLRERTKHPTFARSLWSILLSHAANSAFDLFDRPLQPHEPQRPPP